MTKNNNLSDTKYLKGVGISEGIVSGRLCFFNRCNRDKPIYHITDTNAEIDKWVNAVSIACEQLCKLSDKTKSLAGEEIAELFLAHVGMLEDIDFGDRVSELIISDKIPAQIAIEITAKEYYDTFATIDDEYLSARCIDVLDISERVLNIISGKRVDYSRYSKEYIVAADYILPSEAAELMFADIAGFVLNNCDKYGHAAIMARTLGVPMITEIELTNCCVLINGDVTINGSTGEIICSSVL